MQQLCKAWAPLLARIIIGGMFIQAGVLKMMDFAGTVAFTESVGVPMATTAVAVAIAIEVLGGLSVLFGWHILWGASVLALFTIVASLYFHSNFADQTQMLLFVKNMGIVAALLYMTAFGAGKFSLRKN